MNSFADWQANHNINPWTRVHGLTPARAVVDTTQDGFELAYVREQAETYRSMWLAECDRSARYRAQIVKACLVPFDAEPAWAWGVDEGVA